MTKYINAIQQATPIRTWVTDNQRRPNNDRRKQTEH